MSLEENPLRQVANSVAQYAPHSRVAVIFDLDSTLFCVSPRTQAILRRLGNHDEFQAKNGDLAQLLKSIEVLPTDWGIRSVLERNKAQAPMEVFKEVRNFWRTHFFSNHDLDKDIIYPSANEYVTHLHKLGAEILYLTGRNERQMGEGTRRMLAEWGFPLYDNSNLIMKPSDVETDEFFKAHILRDLIKNYKPIWFFENEPVIIDAVRSEVPEVRIVFVDSVHSGRSLAPRDLPRIGMDYRAGLPRKE